MNLVASAKDTCIRHLLEGRLLQRVDNEKKLDEGTASYGRRRVGALVVISTVLPSFVVGTLDIVTALQEGLFSRNPVKIVRKSWA
jgi:hypothetical protein